jgi:hypothetical protein
MNVWIADAQIKSEEEEGKTSQPMSLFRGLPSPLFFFNAAEGNCAVDAFSQTRLARSIQAIPYF